MKPATTTPTSEVSSTREETRAGVTARITHSADGCPTVTCAHCGCLLVDDDRGPFYNAYDEVIHDCRKEPR